MNAKRAKFRSAANVQDQQSFNSKLNPKVEDLKLHLFQIFGAGECV